MKRVLAIDDDPAITKILEVLLKKRDIECHSVKDPKDFFEQFKEISPDLCLVDLNLEVAQGAGLQMIRAIRNKLGEKLPIVVVSGRRGFNEYLDAVDAGADDYVVKPIIPDDFYRRVLPLIDPGVVGFAPSKTVPITGDDSKAFMEISIDLQELSETEGRFVSSWYMAPGAEIDLSSHKVIGRLNLSKMVMKVDRCERNDDDLYDCHFDIDFIDPAYRSIWRVFLFRNGGAK